MGGVGAGRPDRSPTAGIDRLRGNLLAQIRAQDAPRVASWADHPGCGLVLTGRAGLDTAVELRASGFSQPLLVDAARYVRNASRPAWRRTDCSPAWISWQRQAGVTVPLTDSGYIGHGASDRLRAVLRQAERLGDDVVAVLPLHSAWLVDDIERLVTEVIAANRPVALVVEHQADPLGVPAVVAGLARLLALPVPVLLLRGDVSALGALCWGARTVAVGIRPALRELFGRDRPADALFVPRLLRFLDTDEFEAAALADPLSPSWRCHCTLCEGVELTWLCTVDDHTAADAHAISALRQLREQLLGASTRSSRRRDAWLLHCAAAARAHAELGDALFGLGDPPALTAWPSADRVSPDHTVRRT